MIADIGNILCEASLRLSSISWSTFLTNPEVPADNNASERSVRPVKTKMRVSGQFKNTDGATAYTNLHSIIQTARKNN